METKNIILIVIVILVVALVGVGAYIMTQDTKFDLNNMTSNNTNNTSNNTVATVENQTNATNATNTTVVGDNSTRVNETNNTNTTFKVYVPQSDSYVEVIGEKYDAEVNRWYTYDTDGVRYYNTRIN